MHLKNALLVGPALVSAQEAAGGCTRELLISTRDAFFKAGAAKSQSGLKLAAGVKIALNNKPVSSLSATPFPKMTGFTNLKVTAADVETCQIATFRVSPSQILSTRLRLSPAGGAITEVEFLQASKGDQFFRPTGFPSSTPAMWTAKQRPGKPPRIPASWTPIAGTPGKDVSRATCKAGNGTARLLTREELVYVAATYADGLRGEPWGSCVIGHGNSCPRNENGVTTTPNCAKGAGMFGFLTRGRRWVADTDNGVVLGAFYFDYGGTGSVGPGAPVAGGGKGAALFLHEYFKVEQGGLAGIVSGSLQGWLLALAGVLANSWQYAPMKNLVGGQAALQTFKGEARGTGRRPAILSAE
jgi:hypothetical protein